MMALLVMLALMLVAADAQQLPIPSLPTGVSRGNPNAPVHLVEFLDYQCLHCKGTVFLHPPPHCTAHTYHCT
jgi:protein-disulfide isomerase